MSSLSRGVWLSFVCSVRAWRHFPRISPISPPSATRIMRPTVGPCNILIRHCVRSMCRPVTTVSVASTTVDIGEQTTSGTEGQVKIIYDEFFLQHRPPRGYMHPECPERVSTARDELEGVEGLEWMTPSSMLSEKRKSEVLAAVERVHKQDYLDEVRTICAKGGGSADQDTYICPDTFEVCVAASSAWMDAIESAVKNVPAFALVRPPGHHALAGTAMGFCVVCFAVVAAVHALETLGCSRVAMLDFDVHHGNGIAALIRQDPRIRYCSIHQGGIFPGSGFAEDDGPLENIKNLPFFDAGETWDTYEERFEDAIAWLKEFEPDVVLVSAGYDALDVDRLAPASLQTDDYGRMGRRIREVFGDKVAFGLEGGYNLQLPWSFYTNELAHQTAEGLGERMFECN